MKRLITTGILLAAGAVVMIVLGCVLAADMQCASAVRLVQEYRWDAAQARLQRAIGLDPLDARYPAALGDFFLLQSAYSNDKIPPLERARAAYSRALRLNDSNAGYAERLGHILLLLFTEEKDKPALLEDAFRYFKKASSRDPNGFDAAYAIGYAGVSAWNYLDAGQKSFIIGRLRSALGVKPRYAAYIYPHAFSATGDFTVLEEMTPKTVQGYQLLHDFVRDNNLWQWSDRVERCRELYRQREDPAFARRAQEARAAELARTKKILSLRFPAGPTVAAGHWQGASDDGTHRYEGGELWWSGTVSGLIVVPRGEAAIVIRAKGSPVKNIFPYIGVLLDDERIGGTFVASSEWKEYAFTVSGDGTAKVLSVTFLNDAADPLTGEDRNVYLGEARAVSHAP